MVRNGDDVEWGIGSVWAGIFLFSCGDSIWNGCRIARGRCRCAGMGRVFLRGFGCLGCWGSSSGVVGEETTGFHGSRPVEVDLESVGSVRLDRAGAHRACDCWAADRRCDRDGDGGAGVASHRVFFAGGDPVVHPLRCAHVRRGRSDQVTDRYSSFAIMDCVALV